MKQFILMICFLLIASVAHADRDYQIALKDKATGNILSTIKTGHSIEFVLQAYPNYDVELFPTFTVFSGVAGNFKVVFPASQPSSPLGNTWQWVKDRLDAAFYLKMTDDKMQRYLEQKERGVATTLTVEQFNAIVDQREAYRALLGY